MACANAPTKLKDWHTQIVDYQIANPGCTIKSVAEAFGKSVPWLYAIVGSDAFKEYRAERMAQHREMVSERVVDKMVKLTDLTLDLMHDRIDDNRATVPLEYVKDVAEMSLNSLGFGPEAQRKRGTDSAAAVQVNLTVGASKELLQQSRERMRRLHANNTRPSDAEDAVEVLPPMLGEPQ